MKRTPMKPGTKQLTRRQSLQASSSLSRSPVKRREVALRQRSKKGAQLDRIYFALRREFLALNPWCKCGAPTQVVQHRQGRGSHYLDVLTWSARCAACEHDEHDNPTRSYANGDLLRRNSA